MKYIVQQVKVDPAALASYDWSGRTIKYHRAQIREAFGFREATRADEELLAAWLSEEVCPVDLSEDRLREALVARCRAQHIEPPGRQERVLAAASATFDKRFCADERGPGRRSLWGPRRPETPVRRSAGWPIVQQTVISETTVRSGRRPPWTRSQPVSAIIVSEGLLAILVGRLTVVRCVELDSHPPSTAAGPPAFRILRRSSSEARLR